MRANDTIRDRSTSAQNSKSHGSSSSSSGERPDIPDMQSTRSIACYMWMHTMGITAASCHTTTCLRQLLEVLLIGPVAVGAAASLVLIPSQIAVLLLLPLLLLTFAMLQGQGSTVAAVGCSFQPCGRRSDCLH